MLRATSKVTVLLNLKGITMFYIKMFALIVMVIVVAISMSHFLENGLIKVGVWLGFSFKTAELWATVISSSLIFATVLTGGTWVVLTLAEMFFISFCTIG